MHLVHVALESLCHLKLPAVLLLVQLVLLVRVHGRVHAHVWPWVLPVRDGSLHCNDKRSLYNNAQNWLLRRVKCWRPRWEQGADLAQTCEHTCWADIHRGWCSMAQPCDIHMPSSCSLPCTCSLPGVHHCHSISFELELIRTIKYFAGVTTTENMEEFQPACVEDLFLAGFPSSPSSSKSPSSLIETTLFLLSPPPTCIYPIMLLRWI